MALSGSIDSAVSDVMQIIEENPSSDAAKHEVERRFREVLGGMQGLHSYRITDLLRIIQLSVLFVGYSRRGISYSGLLNSVASSIPDSLGIDAVFPVVEEDGKRRLWYHDDMLQDVRVASVVHGRAAALGVLKKFGDYALFIAGLMPDVLLQSKRKGGVDVGYYESTGARAFRRIAEARGDEVADLVTIDWLASNFRSMRVIMNEAGMIAGTFSGVTFREMLFAERGLGDAYVLPKGRMKPEISLREGRHPGNNFGEEYGGGKNFSPS